jgi:hypothetical protein
VKTQEFNRVFEEVVAKSSAVLVKKADEYADDSDRLHNFKQAAHLEKRTVRQAISGMMVKHTVSVYDMMSAQDCPSLDIWDEKIIDHINYLILLRAAVVEELHINEQKQDR